MLERRLNLGPTAGLGTTVRVRSDALGGQHFSSLVEQIEHLLTYRARAGVCRILRVEFHYRYVKATNTTERHIEQRSVMTS